jgi:hypothetical protein
MFKKSVLLILIFVVFIFLFVPAGTAIVNEKYTDYHYWYIPAYGEPQSSWYNRVKADTIEMDAMLFWLVDTGRVKDDTCLKIGEDVPDYCIKYNSSTGDMEINSNSTSNTKLKLYNAGSGVFDIEVEGTFYVGTLNVGVFACTNCLGLDQIQDIYYTKSADENVGIVRVSDGTDDALDTGNEVCTHFGGETCMDVYHFASGLYDTTEDCTTVDPNSGGKFYVECR